MFCVTVACFLTVLACLSNVTGVSQPLSCDERLKLFSEGMELRCSDKNGNCTWFHMMGSAYIPIERRFTDDSGNINLLPNDLYSFGTFVVNSTNASQCYEVCPSFADNSKYS